MGAATGERASLIQNVLPTPRSLSTPMVPCMPWTSLRVKRETEPGPGDRRALGAEPLEGLEQARLLLVGESGTGVANREADERHRWAVAPVCMDG